MGKIESWTELDDERRARVLQVLEHRFGDGTVYLCEPADREGHAIGRAIGLIGADGLITTSGRNLLSRGQCWAEQAQSSIRSAADRGGGRG